MKVSMIEILNVKGNEMYGPMDAPRQSLNTIFSCSINIGEGEEGKST